MKKFFILFLSLFSTLSISSRAFSTLRKNITYTMRHMSSLPNALKRTTLLNVKLLKEIAEGRVKSNTITPLEAGLAHYDFLTHISDPSYEISPISQDVLAGLGLFDPLSKKVPDVVKEVILEALKKNQ